MRHRVSTIKLKRESAPRQALLRSLARSLVLHGQIETTLAKAKAVRPFVEKLVTLGKRHDRQAERLLLQQMPDQVVVAKLLGELAKQFATREGGYTRIRRTGYRQGDGSEMAQLSFVGSAN
ncbi:MAG: 50S ribosomal protein L17 [Candidatus Andersenbacteria bacterium]